MSNYYAFPKWDKETTQRMYRAHLDYVEKLTEDINTIIAELPKWNGKVLNARFTNTINPKMKHFVFHLGETNTGYKTITNEDGKEETLRFPVIYLKYEYIGGNYWHSLPVDDQIHRPIELLWEDNCRLKAQESIEWIKELIYGVIEEETKEFEDATTNYDKHKEQYEELKRVIKKYNETRNKRILPYIWVDASM